MSRTRKNKNSYISTGFPQCEAHGRRSTPSTRKTKSNEVSLLEGAPLSNTAPPNPKSVPANTQATLASPNIELLKNSPNDDAIIAASGSGHSVNPPTTKGGEPPDPDKIFRHGIDSLYLSYKGKLFAPIEARLEALKQAAQSEDDGIKSTAQLLVGEHIFEVKDKGKTGFPYILTDNYFHIQLSSSKASHQRPMAYVQISSNYLSHVTPEKAEQALREVIEEFGQIEGEATLSRVDLFVDFSTLHDPASFAPHYVTRALKINTYSEGKNHTGITIGMGGKIGFRLYNKTREIRNRYSAFYLYELWSKNGWDGISTVWRAEFEVKQEALKEFNIIHLYQLIKLRASLWNYLTTSWLRLTVPNPADSHSERWPPHPLWQKLSAAFETDVPQPMLTRCKTQREPSDDYLFKQGFAGVTSFMAREGIADPEEGIRTMLMLGKLYHNQRSHSPEGFGHYLRRKIREKNRKYNTEKNSAE